MPLRNEKTGAMKDVLLFVIRVSALVTPLLIIYYLVQRLFG